jgi:hypothetical protein
MTFDFIFMLTSDDRTIPDARARLDEVLRGGATHIGFKDVGLPISELKLLAGDIRAAGCQVYLEVVSLDAQSELKSVRAGIDLEVDCLLGGTRADQVTTMLNGCPIRYYPFPGQVVDHPSVLKGSSVEITDSAIKLTSIEGVHGLDLLAFRYQGDVPELMQSVCETSDKPVIMAGSIDCEERIAAAASSGAAGFTVGTAAFQNKFPSEKTGLIGQVETILKMANHYNRRPGQK